MNFSQWPSSPPISFNSSKSEIDEFSLFIPNISLPDPGRETLNESPKFISIFCEKDEVDDFISRGFLLVYSINAHLVPAPETLRSERLRRDNRNDTLSREPGEKRYYKMIKKVN